MKTTKVLQTNISETNISEVSRILNTSNGNRVAICNANTLVRSIRDRKIRNSVNNFTVKTPDGFPVAKALSFLTKQKFSRVDGYKVFLQTIEDGLDAGRKHYFFGNNENITQLMIEKLYIMFPEIKINGHLCPKFLDADELVEKYKDDIKKIDADIFWVSLGFPKQELFIDRERITSQVKRTYRNPKFRKKVLDKYGSTCCCCDITIETLLEAAHIIPVENNGNDDAVNGIPLCPTHHTAFDNFLFTINPSDKSIIYKEGLSSSDLQITKKECKLNVSKESLEYRFNLFNED